MQFYAPGGVWTLAYVDGRFAEAGQLKSEAKRCKKLG